MRYQFLFPRQFSLFIPIGYISIQRHSVKYINWINNKHINTYMWHAVETDMDARD